MGIVATKPRVYDPASGDNVYGWIVEEVARIRHYNQVKKEAQRPAAPKPPPQSLRNYPQNTPRTLLHCEKASLHAASKDPFEISKARKL
jgi:hypothetical protein